MIPRISKQKKINAIEIIKQLSTCANELHPLQVATGDQRIHVSLYSIL